MLVILYHLRNDCETITRARSSSSNSSSASSISSSRSSSSSSYADSSCSSSDSSTISSSSSDSHSSISTTISSIAKNMNKLKISNNKNSFSSIGTSSSEQSNRFPQAGAISVYKSTKSGDFLCLHGYTYQIDRRMKNKIKWKWKHSRNKIRCGAKIYTTENVGTDQIPAYKYINSNHIQHSHDEDHDQQKVEIFKSQLKNIGTNNRTLPSSKIINQLATSMKLTETQFEKSIYRARSKTIPPLPKSINFDIPAAFSTTSSDEKFIYFDHLYSKQTKRIIAFASPMQLKMLFTSKLICIDGTFSICPRQYKQLLIIQSIDQKNYDATPVLYVLLNDKKARTYTILFRALKSTAKEMKMKFEPDKIISDFESGIVSTIKKELPNTAHQCCLFHLYQRLTKKLKKIVMAIVLLKPLLIGNAYELLANQYLKLNQLKQFRVQLTKFMLYFEKQWMKLKIRKMISFYDVEFKTNNWSESYNAVLQRRAQQSHLSIWILIELLITEETAVHTVFEINQKVIELNQKFEDGEIELDDCLTSVSELVGVKYDKWRKQLKKNQRRMKDDSDDD
ncbi:unnamed protein product [Rotaria sp. Silwood2]|nr:unnamed protein product [Rotaria sp. Silwood2]CAF2716863.1 unnamed protein product [Rotaria sp. Silwood2]CAF2873034.1 unnamed protein product [Rotaria sp. Silwood2]CAF3378342.1 unnamed protein product [Rotaria sp. Silwood2]CAF4337230.1 unnamed protein product [Rotaria sp. Silwood2]